MMRALYSAATGMQAQQTNLDTIANNLANVNTTGFRANKAEFQDLVYQQLRSPGSPVGASMIPAGIDVGLGSKVSATAKIFTQGTLVQTDNPLDVAIEGDGFFQVTMPDGTTAYTRDGSFKIDANGAIVTADGYLLSPQITIPQQIGQINLARFVNPAGLQAQGHNLLTQTAASGAPTISQPGLNGAGTLQGGYLENSNVSVVTEIVNMIVAQRAYEANSKAITTADQMLQTANQTKV